MKGRNQATFLSTKNKGMTQRSFSERKKYATGNNHLSKMAISAAASQARMQWKDVFRIIR